MKALKFLAVLLLPISFFMSCTKDLNINDNWKEIMVVYGLLNPYDSVHYIKITKAFLGPGNALQYATIPDSSNFAHKLKVRLEEYDGNNLINTIYLDTTTLTSKDTGIFYFPNQLVYYTTAQLNKDYQYKILITDTVSGVEVTASTSLVNPFSITAPNAFSKANFVQGSITTAEWISAKWGKMYQLNIRFNYWEIDVADTSKKVRKSVDWQVFNDVKSRTNAGGEEMAEGFYGDGFFYTIKAKVPYDPNVIRIPDSVEYIFNVASEELSNYIEVTNPSNTIVQEKPLYTNVSGGIGIFSSRINNTIFSPRRLRLSDRTYDSLTDGVVTGNLF